MAAALLPVLYGGLAFYRGCAVPLVPIRIVGDLPLAVVRFELAGHTALSSAV